MADMDQRIQGKITDKIDEDMFIGYEAVIQNESVLDGLVKFKYDGNLNIISGDNRFFMMSGLSRDEYRNLFDDKYNSVILSGDWVKVKKIIEDAIEHKTAFVAEYRIKESLSGAKTIWRQLRGTVSEDEDNVLKCVITDITAKNIKSYLVAHKNYNSNKPYKNVNSILETMVDDIFNLIEGKEDIGSVLSKLLNDIGNQFDLSAITIRIFNEEKTRLNLWLGWNNSEELPALRDYYELKEGEWNSRYGMHNRDKILTVDKTNFNVADAGIEDMIFCTIHSEDDMKGVICFADARGKRKWKYEEMQIMRMLEKVIATNMSTAMALAQIEDKVYRLTCFDEITGLYKTDKFKFECQKILSKANPEDKFAIINSDFSNFEYVNDTYGTETGDKILREFAKLISEGDEEIKINCRNYADYFLTFVKYDDQEAVIEKINRLNIEFMNSKREEYKGCNIEIFTGIYYIQDNDIDVVKAINNSNIARKVAKAEKCTDVAYFDDVMRRKIREEGELINDFAKAMENEEFKVYLQPKVWLDNERVVSAEALVRWIKPDGTIVNPNDFVPVLEKNRKIVALDMYIYEHVVELLGRWQRQGRKLIPISVNLSRLHVDNKNLADELYDIAVRYGVSPKYIELEITESAFVDNAKELINTMHNIQDKGFSVSIDDFGTGYSSLNMLTEVPANYVKIDKEFLNKEKSLHESQNVIKFIINLSKDFNMRVICEGVEKREQVDFLKEAGCDMAQGYYYSKPVNVLEFEQFDV